LSFAVYTEVVEYHVEWGGSPQDVTIRTSGTASAADAVVLFRNLSEDERYRSGLKILVDQTELQAVDYSPDELQTQIEYVVSMKAKAKAKLQPVYCAIVVPEPAVYGTARIWEAEVGGVAKATTRLFRSTEDALIWLRDLDVGSEGASGA
jgi:hypothetical protein